MRAMLTRGSGRPLGWRLPSSILEWGRHPGQLVEAQRSTSICIERSVNFACLRRSLSDPGSCASVSEVPDKMKWCRTLLGNESSTATHSTRSIELLDDQKRRFMTGSGFVTQVDGRYYLVSNAHVFSGLKPNSDYMVPEARSIPFYARVSFLGTDGIGKFVNWTLPLLDVGKRALWLQDAAKGRAVDVAVLPLETVPQIEYLPIELDGKVPVTDHDGACNRVTVEVTVTQRVYVVGYPLGLDGGLNTASIWVGATIATEPAFDIDGHPRLLVDGATRSGLSGAPVYARWARGEMVPFSDPAYDLASAALMSPTTSLVGIYSGRISEASDLGYVWKPSVIAEIIRNGVRGDPVGDILGGSD